MTLESSLQVALLLAAPRELPDLRLFRRNIGAVRFMGGQPTSSKRAVQFGIAGQSDLYALVRGGMHIEIELKAASAPKRPPPDQEAWANWCKSWGVPHIVLRGEKEETVEQTVKRWCNELRNLLEQSRHG